MDHRPSVNLPLAVIAVISVLAVIAAIVLLVGERGDDDRARDNAQDLYVLAAYTCEQRQHRLRNLALELDISETVAISQSCLRFARQVSDELIYLQDGVLRLTPEAPGAPDGE